MADHDDEALVEVVLGRIQARMADPYSLRGLSEVEADLICSVTAKGIIDNGGHAYWYEGMDRDNTLRAAWAFERMGVRSVADAMRQSLDAFPGGIPTSAYLAEHRDRLEEAFSAFDHVVWDIDFDAIATEYIRARKSDLFAVDAGLKKAAPALWEQ